MHVCRECGGEVDPTFRFCPWCAVPLRSKLVQFFFAHPKIERDRGKALRVSRYLGDERHVRFSVWDESGAAQAAVSIDEDEAKRLARFVGESSVPRRRRLRPSLSLRRTLSH
jgi:hypothetical protein